jgi:endogenous inhibitor of DNA gyrase (YacG/DUF329 family)
VRVNAAVDPTVTCPTCHKAALYGARNPWRPFCSERCRSVDLGAWASERFRVAAEAPSDPGADPRADPPPDSLRAADEDACH